MTITAIAGGVGLTIALKFVVEREQPKLEHLVNVYTDCFPSGHAMLSTVVYLTLCAQLAISELQSGSNSFS